MRTWHLLLCILCMLCLSSVALASEGTIPEEYQMIAQNSRFQLYLQPDTLAVIVESKATGKLLFSTVQNPDDMKDNATWKGFYQSGIVMEYLDGVKTIPLQADFINTESSIDLFLTGDGYRAKVFYPEIGISYEVSLTMDERGFQVSVPGSSIREENPDTYTVASFYVYPFMGYSYLGEDEGYMIIPDGQGAIIELKDNEERFSSPFDRTVYGTNIGVETGVYSDWSVDAEQVLLPAFGMVHSGDQMAFLGFIEDGDAAARIMAYPNGVRMKFDWVCAKYLYRLVYSQPTGPNSSTISMRTEHARGIDICQQFLLEEGGTATYAGLACALRDYMTEKGYFGEADPTAFDIAVDFLGAETENFVLGKKSVPMTTFEDAGKILKALGDRGVKGISVTYRGWQEGGLSGALPTDAYAPARSLGGDGELQKLMELSRELDNRLSLEADFLHLNTQTHPLLFYSSFKSITSQTWSRPTFGKVYDTMYLLSPAKSLEIGRSTIQQFSQHAVPGISLTGLPSLMSDFYESNHYQDSSLMMARYEDLVKESSSQLETSLTKANCYLWRHAAALKDMPVSGSDYSYVLRDIPFLAIAVSGKIPYYTEYANFQANTHSYFLHLIEQGTRPTFLLTYEDPIRLQNTNSNDIYSSSFDLYEDLIVSWWGELSDLHAVLGHAQITDHVKAGDMVRVTWSNGTKVYLNFGNADALLDGVSLPGGEYKVVAKP
ncbi:MAG: hypothetical protein IJ083_06310 [Clostridia bacterium]|nr:hypothetical protein [Clostridia bacterium]